METLDDPDTEIKVKCTQKMWLELQLCTTVSTIQNMQNVTFQFNNYGENTVLHQ